MDLLNAAFSILAFVIATLTVERTMRVFFEERKVPFAATVFSYLLLLFTLMLHLHEIADVFLHFLALTIISLNYKSVAMKRVAAVAGGHFVLQALTDINSFLARFLPTAWVVHNEVLALVLTSLFIYLVARVVFPLFKHIKKSRADLNKLWLPLIIFPIAYTVISLFRHVNLTAFAVIVVVLNNLGIILIFFYLYNSLSKVFEDSVSSALHAQEREYYFTQCELMQESVDKMKAYRHDVKLHLAALKKFTPDNKEARDYLNTLLGDVEESEIYSDTGNIAFDSIINFKIKDVLENHINFQLNIFIPPALNIEVADVVTILGNLLDNAFDAVAKVEDKMVKLTVEVKKGVLFIRLDNTYDGVVNYAAGKDGAKTGIVSRKDGENHGYGLRNIQKSVEKYDGQIDISHEGNVFSVNILMYVEDVKA